MSSATAGEDRGPVVLTITIALLVASTAFTIVRFVSRIGVVRRVTPDDYFIAVAWLLAFGFSFSICWGVHNGLGRHEIDVPPENRSTLRKSEYAFSVLYNPVLMATKTSILIFYLSLSKNQQIFKWASWATLAVVNIAGLALTFLNIFQCTPVGAVFQQVVPADAVCTNIVSLYLSSAPVNIITDLVMLFLPMPILTGIRLPRKQKIILIITFSFGAFVTAVDVVRIAYLQSAFQTHLAEIGTDGAPGSRVLERDDFSWYASLSFMWSAIEVHVGIICACVPSLKPLVSKILPGLIRDTSNPADISGFHDKDAAPREDFKVAQHSPLPPESPARAQPMSHTVDDDMDIMDFLTTPDMANPATRTQTVVTNNTSTSRRSSRAGSGTFFDFYNMKKTRPMTKLTTKQSYVPLALVTILFFLWGFAYGLLDILNSQFQLVVHMSSSQALGLHASYFAAYFIGPLTIGRVVLKKWGFKATFITGLCIYGCGTLIFWPSAVLTSFTAFIISNFIVGLGVSILEVAANPFIALCGPPQHSETRLNLSQGVQAIGSVVSPLLAKKVLFKNVLDPTSLIDVQWTYLGIAFFDILLAAAFYYMPIPEASDEDFEDVAEKRSSVNSARFGKLGNIKVIYITLALGVFSEWCYVGLQEAAASCYQDYISVVVSGSSIGPFNYQTVGHTVFAVGRFLSAFAGLFVKPRWILLFLYIGMIVTAACAMNFVGSAGVAMIVLFMFFESGVFPLIFAISLRGLGSHTKSGSVYLTASISGGAIFPVIMNAVGKSHGLQYSFCVVVAVAAFGTLFPLYLIASPAAKKQVDPVVLSRRSVLPQDRPQSHGERASRIFHNTIRRKKDTSTDSASVEHVEGEKDEWADSASLR